MCAVLVCYELLSCVCVYNAMDGRMFTVHTAISLDGNYATTDVWDNICNLDNTA